jgi:predicted dithiol-disulfide oxidoreductase (DUF899 family)
MSTTLLEAPGNLAGHPVVSREEWTAARRNLLAQEKELTRQRDALCAARRDLPWVKVDKDYVFDGPDGPVRLADLFDGRSQLIVYHFMFGPGWKEGCSGCSFVCDHVDAARQHFEQRDVSFVAVSRAPLAEFAPFKQRMGWKFRWVSSAGSDFNFDYHVSFTPEQIAAGQVEYNYGTIEPWGEEAHGTSVFYKNAAGEIFHTYSSYARGCEQALGTFMFMDLTPKGRNEESIMNWIRHHDRYESAADGCCGCGKDS